jgi:hypothetical protein
MAKVIHIPRVGNISFPDEMNDNAIANAASEAHGEASLVAVMNFVQGDPAFRKMKPSEAYKNLQAVAEILEKYPSLVRAIDVGMTKVSSPSARTSGPPAPQAPAPAQQQTGESDQTSLPSEPPSANADNSTTEGEQ